MRLLLLLFVVLFAKTESLSLGSFFNGLLGFSDDSQIIGTPSKSEGLLNETNEIFLNDTSKVVNDSVTLQHQNPEEYEYQDIEEATTVSLQEETSSTSELSSTVTEAVVTEDVVTETTTSEVTTESNSGSTIIPQTELGDFVAINSDNSIDEGSGEDIPKGITFLAKTNLILNDCFYYALLKSKLN
uniref:Uncharacterized protein n=1 Tax=Panagrolaimus sp. ES5 TaxID=591445 RepID=A0AC34F0Y2_9BILA